MQLGAWPFNNNGLCLTAFVLQDDCLSALTRFSSACWASVPLRTVHAHLSRLLTGTRHTDATPHASDPLWQSCMFCAAVLLPDPPVENAPCILHVDMFHLLVRVFAPPTCLSVGSQVTECLRRCTPCCPTTPSTARSRRDRLWTPAMSTCFTWSPWLTWFRSCSPLSQVRLLQRSSFIAVTINNLWLLFSWIVI